MEAKDEAMGAEAKEDPVEVANKASRASLALAQRAFEASLLPPGSNEAQTARAELLADVESGKLGVFYDLFCQQLGWPVDEALRARLKKENDAEIAAFDATIATTCEQHGDIEVAAEVTKKAVRLAAIGDKAGALAAYGDIPAKAMSTGQKADVDMAAARVGFVHGDKALIGARIASAKALNDKGGDWDRRNRLKVYEGVLCVFSRDFAKAAELLLDSVSTFTAVELLSYEHFMLYCVLAALKTLDRPRLKKKVIDSPDVISVLSEEPVLAQLLNAFYEGRYADFLGALVALQPRLARDRFFAPHASWYLREMRVAAYVQFLESYKSVTLAGMAQAFGVSPKFLDGELSRFIAAGRVNAKLDAATGVIESTRPDSKNGQYLSVVKQGDALLNKIQKLSRMATS